MDYSKIYDRIVERRKKEKPKGYKECHHIVPKCMGGSDEKQNIVELTAREHFICHLLLTRMYPNNPKLWYALDAMITLDLKKKRYTPSSRVIKEIKEKTSKTKKQTRWINKEGVCKKVLKQQVGSYLKKGWKKGRGLSYNRGKIAVVRNGKTSYISKKNLEKYIKEGYSLGNSRKGVKCVKSSKANKGRVCVNNGQQTRRILKEKLNEYLANGWKRGYHYTIDYAARNLPDNTGKVCVWKDEEEKRINKTELKSYEKYGWKRGHNPKYKGNRDR